ncbi:hypothetical protein B0T22DRAFT_455589 [Podospora appendiculata]|uniref:Uncharacterized protein n=1 Tax=Podospora appendiculata TaxID=314037 RepID=A0AAE0XLD9_9PEZI|nr:hypothetical protein B0T22DRAFT_455589 [Podospora appendiculata]
MTPSPSPPPPSAVNEQPGSCPTLCTLFLSFFFLFSQTRPIPYLTLENVQKCRRTCDIPRIAALKHAHIMGGQHHQTRDEQGGGTNTAMTINYLHYHPVSCHRLTGRLVSFISCTAKAQNHDTRRQLQVGLERVCSCNHTRMPCVGVPFGPFGLFFPSKGNI